MYSRVVNSSVLGKHLMSITLNAVNLELCSFRVAESGALQGRAAGSRGRRGGFLPIPGRVTNAAQVLSAQCMFPNLLCYDSLL